MSTYFGKYRGTVINNFDPLQIGRVQISCPAVLGESVLAWAMPCAPYAGDGEGLWLVPPIGANVWIEFEAGDRDKPIWVGGFWNVGRTPALPGLPTTKILKTSGATLKLDDLPGAGGVTIEVGPPVVGVPVKIVLSAQGVEISCGAASVKLDPARVSLNNGALEVI
ncbi:phage baseplate assembly protein V [Sorangium sp. So ce1036]|uniref:phage baseplate assembly protein V n=1 Tax=Sorangium sp. So ce1036 TaxID=3133328 RepID=UPI003F03E18C